MGEVCHQQFERCVSIHVTKGYPHAGFGFAFSIECHPAHMTLVAEGSVGTIDPKTVRIQIIGNIDIGPSVTIKVGRHRCKPGTLSLSHPRFDGHVCKGDRRIATGVCMNSFIMP